MSDRTRVLFGVCRQCKAIVEAHVDPPRPFEVKADLLARDLIARDLWVDDPNKWPAMGCAHHGG